MNHRHRSRTAFICFLLCIPLAFIAYFAIIYYTEGIYAGKIRSVEVTVPGKEASVYEDDENVDFYVGMFRNARPLSAPLGDPEEYTTATVKYAGEGKDLIYKIYPALSLTGCMFADPDGKYFIISDKDAKTLLSRDEFSYLYSEVYLPTMYVATGELQTAVNPVSYEWRYKKIDGTYAEYTGTEVMENGPDTEVYSMYSDRINAIRFAREPDDTTVTISDENGDLVGQTDFNALIFGRDTKLTVTVEAVWNLTGVSVCDGRASYSFDVIYDIPAELSFSSDRAEIGGYMKVDVKYLNDGESVILDTALSTGGLRFTENEGIKTAVLGISDDNLPGVYDITYNIGDNRGTFELTVTGTPREDRDGIYRLNISETDYESMLGETASDEFDDILNEVYALIGDTTYAKISDLVTPTPSGDIALGYGVRVIVNIDNTVETNLLYSIGNSYNVVENSKITAAADGRVIYTGSSATLGSFMVIDHGCGVCSWYYGFTSMEREAGTQVQKGSILGFAGISPYTGEASLGFCVSAGKAFIKPPVE